MKHAKKILGGFAAIVVASSNAMAAGTLGTVSAIDTTDFAAVAIVVLTFAGIAYGVKKALGLIGK